MRLNGKYSLVDDIKNFEWDFDGFLAAALNNSLKVSLLRFLWENFEQLKPAESMEALKVLIFNGHFNQFVIFHNFSVRDCFHFNFQELVKPRPLKRGS